MLKYYFFLISLWFGVNSYGQNHIYIYFNAEKGRIEKIYIRENNGVFVLNNKAELQAVILKKCKDTEMITVINDFENNRIKKYLK